MKNIHTSESGGIFELQRLGKACDGVADVPVQHFDVRPVDRCSVLVKVDLLSSYPAPDDAGLSIYLACHCRDVPGILGQQRTQPVHS